MQYTYISQDVNIVRAGPAMRVMVVDDDLDVY